MNLDIQWNLIITATYGLNISGCYLEVVALQRCNVLNCITWDLTIGDCNNEVAA